MSEVALNVHQLRKIYRRKGREPLGAVNDISFAVVRGECFGLLGPNGAGKSTTMKCVTGFYAATGGTVEIEGLDVHRFPKEARRWLGVCHQDDTLDTDFDVLDQMVQFASFFGIGKAEAKSRAEKLLARFGLEGKANDLVESLSGGMR